MRTDIYVVQKTAEEGKHLEDWCIQNDVTVNMNYGLGFNPEWNCFAYFNSIDAFCKNYKLSSCKLNMQEVTIEEFKRLQLESLGKTEIPLKIGDWVLIKPSEFSTLGEGTRFNDKKDVPLCIEEIDTNIVRKLSGINCVLSFDRFEKCEKPVEEKFITGKWYKWANKTYPNHHYIKLKSFDRQNVFYDERIYHRNYQRTSNSWTIKEVVECDLSEIQEYLPDGHIDKQIQSEEKLQDYIGSSGTCSQSVGLQLKGNTVVQKAEILWNEWNGITGECTLTPQYPIRPTEAYKMISELQCIKPSIIKHKAQLVEVNKKQIFKN